jgi:hypothetical protein
VSGKDFRRDLRRVFHDVSGEPSPALSDRVRTSVAQAPAARGNYWIAAVAACVIAALLVGVLVVGNSFNRRPAPLGPGPYQSPTSSPTTRTPTSTPPVKVPAFTCIASGLGLAASSSASSTPVPVVLITDLRTGTHTGYDRLTLTLNLGTTPTLSIDFMPQAGTMFTASPSGQQLVLKGNNGILVVIHGADLHTDYSGSVDFVTGYPGMAEVRRVEDFEGTVQLGIGINGAACYRAFYLPNPDRVVIDIQTT